MRSATSARAVFRWPFVRKPPRSWEPRTIALGATVIVAAILRVRGIGFNIDLQGGWVGAWHADEYGVWNKAGLIWPDLDPHYWGYPALHLYLVALLNAAAYQVARLTGISSDLDYKAFLAAAPGLRYLLARSLSVASSVATVWLVGRHGHRLLPRPSRTASLLAAVALALCPLHIQHAHFGTLDALFTFLVVVSLLACVDVLEGGGRREHVKAGLSIGLTISEKYNGIVLLLPYAIAAIRGARRRSEGGILRGTAAGIGATVAVGLIVNFFFFLHFQSSWRELTFNVSRVVSIDTGSWIDHPYLIYIRFLGTHVGPALCGLAGLGLVLALRPSAEGGWLAAVLTVAFYLLMSTFGLKVPRYILPIVPLLLLFASHASGALARLVTYGHRARRLSAVILLGAVATTVPRIMHLDAVFRTPDTRLRASRWIREHIAPGSRLVVESHGEYGPTVDDCRYDLIPYTFFRGQPTYGRYVRTVPFLLVGERPYPRNTRPSREGPSPGPDSGSRAPSSRPVPSPLDQDPQVFAEPIEAQTREEAERRAARRAAELGLESWAVHENAETGDFGALLRDRPDFLTVTQGIYANPETRFYRNFYLDLVESPKATLVAVFPELAYDHSPLHPRILVYRIGQPLRTGEDPDAYYPPVGGRAYAYEIDPALVSDGEGDVRASRLVLLEDGTPLGPAHTPHEQIREKGGGRYSHWKDRLIFSTSDNSDPNQNGRRYTWVEMP